MPKELVISTSPHETRVAVLENGHLCEIYVEREKEYALVGSIYKGRVTRVLPGMQSAFVEIGLDTDAFLYVSDVLEEELGEYDSIVATVEEKVQKMEDQGAQLFSRPAEGTSSAVEPTEVVGDSVQPVPPAAHALPVAPSPSYRPASNAPSPAQGQTQGARQNQGGGSNREGGRDGGRRRWRGGRGGRPAPRDDRRDLPHSKYVSNSPLDARPETPGGNARPAQGGSPQSGSSLERSQDRSQSRSQGRSQGGYRAPSESTAYRDTPSASPASDLPPIILPGESLAKYKNRPPAIPVAQATPPAAPPASSTEPTVSHEIHHDLVREVEHEVEHELAQGVEHDFAQPSPPATQPVTQLEPETRRPESAEIPTPRWTAATPAESPAETAASSSHHVEPTSERFPGLLTRAGSDRANRTPESSYAETETPSLPPVQEHHHTEQVTDSRPAESHGAGSRDVDLHAADSSSEELHARDEHHLSEAEAAALLEAAAEDAEAAVLADDEETRLAEAVPELDEEGDTDRQIREDIFEASGQGAGAHDEEHASISDAAADAVADAAHDQAMQPHIELSARVQDNQQQRLQRPQRQGAPPRRGGGRPQHGRSQSRHDAQRGRGQSISDLLKAGQEIIIQIAKEPLGKKGARITSHVALPGRFLVYMPTLEHTGVSRKISSPEQRSRLRHLVSQYSATFPGGFIVRTAAETASDDEVRADIEYLGSTWKEIRARSEQRRAPSLLHRDLNLVERILRDYFSPDFSAIWVDNQDEFARVLEFIGRFQPGLVSRVKLYTKDAPIFEEFGIQQEIDKALRPKVWLKSGGYIVINHTEALVAIDVNTGKFVGRGSTRLEDTIVKTNVEAVKEIVRQIRLRDLGGIIIVDFIDMEERKNRMRVMQALEEALRDDRAPSKVLPFNEFGLVAITRKRTKQALERVLCQPCPYCTGSGMVKSVHTICYEAQAEARKMAAEIDAASVTLRVHPEIAKALKTREAALIDELEQWIKKSVIIQGDPSLHWEQFDIY